MQASLRRLVQPRAHIGGVQRFLLGLIRMNLTQTFPCNTESVEVYASIVSGGVGQQCQRCLDLLRTGLVRTVRSRTSVDSAESLWLHCDVYFVFYVKLFITGESHVIGVARIDQSVLDGKILQRHIQWSQA